MAKSQSQTQTSSQSVDPGTRAFIEAYRNRAMNLPGYQSGTQGVENYFNPYQQNVIGGVQSDFDRQRMLAGNAAGDMATRSGAYGGSREAVLRANALNDVNRNETNTLSGLRYQGYNDALGNLINERQYGANYGLAQLNALTPGFTPTSQNSRQTITQTTPLGHQLLGLGATVAGGLLGGPVGAGVANRLVGSAAGRIGQQVASSLPFAGGYSGGSLNFGQGSAPMNPWDVNPNYRYRR